MFSILPAFSSPDLKVFLLLKKSFKSSAGGQRRDCVIYSVPLSLLSINPTDSPRHASRPWRLSFLVQLCARAGKTVISRPNLCASGSCRALRACPLWHLPSVSASAIADAKTAVKHHRPKRILPPGRICNLDPRLPLEGNVCVDISFLFWKPWPGFLASPYELTM